MNETGSTITSVPTPTPQPTEATDLNFLVDKEITTAKSQDEKSKIEKEGYKVKVKVVDKNGIPIINAKVTLYSTPKVAYTDEEGFATFENVEYGEHNIEIAYEDYKGEMDIQVGGDVREYQYTIKVEPKSSIIKYLSIALAASIITIGLFVITTRLKNRLTY